MQYPYKSGDDTYAMTEESRFAPFTDEMWCRIDLDLHFREIPSIPGTTAYLNVSWN